MRRVVMHLAQQDDTVRERQPARAFGRVEELALRRIEDPPGQRMPRLRLLSPRAPLGLAGRGDRRTEAEEAAADGEPAEGG